MISVVMSLGGDEARLGAALAALVPAAVDNLVKDVWLVEPDPSEGVRLIAEDMGARLVGEAAEAFAGVRGEWLMILPQPWRLRRGWEAEAEGVLAAGPGWAALSVGGEGWLRRAVGGLGRREGLIVDRALHDAVGGGGHGAGAEGCQALLRALRRSAGGRGRVRLEILAG